MPTKTERKILSFSTTMRNPYRIGSFLAILSKYENKILTHEVIMDIVKDIIYNKLYVPNYILQNDELKSCLNSENFFTNKQIEDIIKNAPQNHKEAGFNNGWESRFDTWYKLMCEFGFCYYKKEYPILISDTAKILIDTVYDNTTGTFNDDYDESIIGSVFLNTLAKYEVGNPYKKNLNHNTPFRLLIKLLLKLKQHNKKPISVKEIPILLCWHNDNIDALYDYIIKLRDENYQITGIENSYSPEFIYHKCLNLLESENKKRFKLQQIVSEAVDEYIRKMRITGLISLRGNGRYIDINSLEYEKIEYISKLNSCFQGDYQDNSEDSKLKFYKYMSTVDNFLITASLISCNDNVKIDKLKEMAKSYKAEEIKQELLITCDKSKSSNVEFLKILDKPLRLEFLTAIYLTQHFYDVSIIPNYKSDDEGYPIFTASGGKADIIAFDEKTESYIEVSLIRDRTQTTNEMIPIQRHLQEYIANSVNNKEKFSVFVAPNIHNDSKDYAKFVKYKYNINIPYYAMADFINKVEISNCLIELNDETLLI